jgi:GT2 family glycosyltransferase
MNKSRNWAIIVACNNEEILQNALLNSPEIISSNDVLIQRGFISASIAYNEGIKKSSSDILIFVHQDVYLPEGWEEALATSLAILEERDPSWGVLGVWGVDAYGQGAGYLYSTGLQGFVGMPLSEPTEVKSLDEVLLVIRKGSGLWFDERLPGFHLYGTDICLEALRRGLKNYVVPAFCIHNSRGIRFLPPAYWKVYFYMQRKWWNQLPVHTPCMCITRYCVPALKYCLRRAIWLLFHSKEVGKRCENPAELHSRLLRTGGHFTS